MKSSMQKVLIVNIGSTSLKFNLFDMSNENMLVKGIIEKIGNANSPMNYTVNGRKKVDANINTTSGYGIGISTVLQLLIDKTLILKDTSDLKAIGFKTVHAGDLKDSCIITKKVIKKMEDYSYAAPAHNPPYVKAIEQCQDMFPNIPLVAVFETYFHRHMPDYAYIYSLPYEWYEKYSIRRYGFHGASHCFVTERTGDLLNIPLNSLNIISCHLGGSSSITAVKNGKSIDTSMGFSPQSGIPMSTRCGDIDPFIIPYVMEKEKLSLEEIINILTHQSGLLGMSGISGDMRDLERYYKLSNKSRLALDTFCYEIKKYVGSYLTVLCGLDALVFTGGIGENSALVREKICNGLDFFGIELDVNKNKVLRKEGVISKDSSKVKILIVPTNEEIIVARQTLKTVII